MEKNSKTYALVAWTENGRVRMVPSLANEYKHELLEELITLTEAFNKRQWERDRHGRFTMTPGEEIDGRIEISLAYERLAGVYLDSDAVRDACWALCKAADWCADCSDGLWIYDANSFYPAVPLVRRFYEMHRQVLRLVRQHPSLREIYRGSQLESDFLLFSKDRRLMQEEIREGDEWRKAMNFGR